MSASIFVLLLIALCAGSAYAVPRTSLASGLNNSAPAYVFSPYKDVGIDMDWHTFDLKSRVSGSLKTLSETMPPGNDIVTLAFAIGECGSETWAGATASNVISGGISRLASAGKKYIVSTGGAGRVFSCGSYVAFDNFISRYNIRDSLVGIDFDIEAPSTPTSVIENLVAHVVAAKVKYPHLRFSFTLTTGANSDTGAQSLSITSVRVLTAIKAAGLTGVYINLMAMDWGPAEAAYCVITDGKCDMGKSAIQAAKNLHLFWNIPYNFIEVTPMIGQNDREEEVFTLEDIDVLMQFVKASHLGGVHFWAFDRDMPCGPGASSTCNRYSAGGLLGFTKSFLKY